MKTLISIFILLFALTQPMYAAEDPLQCKPVVWDLCYETIVGAVAFYDDGSYRVNDTSVGFGLEKRKAGSIWYGIFLAPMIGKSGALKDKDGNTIGEDVDTTSLSIIINANFGGAFGVGFGYRKALNEENLNSAPFLMLDLPVGWSL